MSKSNTAAVVSVVPSTANVAPSEPTVKDLFASVDTVNAQIAELTAKLASLEIAKSNIIHKIFIKAGKGPFSRNGKVLTIVNRHNKGGKNGGGEKIGTETWFFRGEGEKEVTSMD